MRAGSRTPLFPLPRVPPPCDHHGCASHQAGDVVLDAAGRGAGGEAPGAAAAGRAHAFFSEGGLPRAGAGGGQGAHWVCGEEDPLHTRAVLEGQAVCERRAPRGAEERVESDQGPRPSEGSCSRSHFPFGRHPSPLYPPVPVPPTQCGTTRSPRPAATPLPKRATPRRRRRRQVRGRRGGTHTRGERGVRASVSAHFFFPAKLTHAPPLSLSLLSGYGEAGWGNGAAPAWGGAGASTADAPPVISVTDDVSGARGENKESASASVSARVFVVLRRGPWRASAGGGRAHVGGARQATPAPCRQGVDRARGGRGGDREARGEACGQAGAPMRSSLP